MNDALEMVEFPITRDELVGQTADNFGDPDVINLFKSLPEDHYQSRDDLLRDVAEAARRFAMGLSHEGDGALRDRRNIGRDAVEGAPPGMTRHP